MKRRWRIGELAEATGLTVRALHHYEQIGLLTPHARTEGRQRLYDERDVQRIYRICALKDLGLPLPEIARVLRSDRAPFGLVLRAQRERIDAEIARLRKLRGLLDHLDDDLDVDTMLATIEAMSRVVRHGEAQKRSNTEGEWRKVAKELRACMDAGEAPSSRRVRPIAAKARALIAAFAGGDEKVIAALAHLRKHAPPKQLAGWDPALMRYLDRALEKEK